MSERRPDFDELVGPDLAAEERGRLLRVHELLLQAEPPPEVTPRAPVIELHPRRRHGLLAALAATFITAAFAVGVVVGDRTAGRDTDVVVGDRTAGRDTDSVVAMEGTPAAPTASASLVVYEIDDAGNWPMEMTVEGLAPAESGRPYELWLTKDGELAALCGYFKTDFGGSASVPMNAPYKFKEHDGWVVVEEGSETPLLVT
jgi:hypothetical protein